MGLLGVVGKIRKVLGKITDILLIGRNKGWWDERNSPKPPSNRGDVNG